MTESLQKFGYDSMGTRWNISMWDPLEPSIFKDIQNKIFSDSTEFDHTYSRFIKDSLIWKLTEQRGVIEVPEHLVKMLRLYEKFYQSSRGKCNPLVGFAISDMGYDADYSLKPKEHIRPVPELPQALSVIDDTHIELRESVLIDLGALGKGYFVDQISKLLRSRGIMRFLVDGSGDIYYKGSTPLKAGLEHPEDPTKVIGVIELKDKAMCGSGSNRRKWAQYHHTIDPDSLTSPQDILATWVIADSTAVADGLATCLFLVEAEELQKDWEFEYCILRNDYKVKRSEGFVADLF